MRWLRRVSGIIWIFSWYTIYLEIFRWHHMTKSLRFNPPPPPPGTGTRPKAGAPLIAVCLGSVAAPLVFLTATMMERGRRRAGGTPLSFMRTRQLSPRSQAPAFRVGGDLGAPMTVACPSCSRGPGAGPAGGCLAHGPRGRRRSVEADNYGT